ncbi:MAG TPA: YceI family protein [Pseudobdellovibrionaceae bacterium]|jgi:polyisoprenoid-binding protein YceI
MKTALGAIFTMMGLGVNAGAAPLPVIKGHIEFLAIGKPSAIKIRGKGDDLKSEAQWKEKQLSGKFTFNLESLDTGIELRTNHMKEKYLETGKFSGKFKNAELELKPVALAQDPCKESVKVTQAPFEGTLNLHGVQHPVKGDFDATAEKGKGHAQIRFELNITDYKIEIPVYLGIKVTDQVQNTVDLDWVCAQ